MRQSLIALWKSEIRMHRYRASFSHRGRLKRPCTYLNGPPMHIKLRVEASTGISSKTRLIITDAEKQHDYSAFLRGTKMWPNPHLMVADSSRCTLCQNPFGLEGCFTVGSCGVQFHPPCLISYMIKKRSCPHCLSPFHSLLYLQFGLLKYIPSNWVCDPKDFPFPLGEWSGAEMEWSWRHQRLKVENLHQKEDGEWITDPTQVLYAATELYPKKPNTHGLKGFFFQTLNWHSHEPSQTLRQGIHPPFYASSGEPARSTASFQQDIQHLPHLGISSEAEELHWEEMYHRRRLMYHAIDAILN